MGLEREKKISLGRKIRVYSGLFLRDGLKCITDIPFAIRATRAPEGELVREGEVRAKGKIVRYSGETYVILTKENVMVFPNQQAGDIIKPLPNK